MEKNIKDIPDLFMGVEIDIYTLFEKSIKGDANLESQYLDEILKKIIDDKIFKYIKKRGFLNKNEGFFSDIKNTFGLSVDYQNLEYNSLPFRVTSESIDTIVFQIYSDLSKIAFLLQKTGINPFEMFLPINLPGRNRNKSEFQRLSGIHLNFSSSGQDGLSEVEKKLFIRLIPILNLCQARALINGVRSPRSALLSFKKSTDLGQSEKQVPIELARRWRGNGVQLSIPSAEWPVFFTDMKRLLQVITAVHRYIHSSARIDEDCWLINSSDDEYFSFLEKINQMKATPEESDIFISHIEASLPVQICNRIGLKNLKKKLKHKSVKQYFKEHTLGNFLKSNFNFIKRITPSVQPLNSIIKKDLLINEYFSNADFKKNLIFEAIDWELCTININGASIIVPNEELISGAASFHSDEDVNAYILKRLDESISILKKKYPEDEIEKINISRPLSKLKKIILNKNESLRINLYSKSISTVDHHIILLLAALTDAHNLTTSSILPWKISIDNHSLISAGASDLRELSGRILNDFPPLIGHIFKKNTGNMILKLSRIEGPLNLISAIKFNNDTEGIEFNPTNENNNILSLFERMEFSNASGLKGMLGVYLQHREQEQAYFIQIDRLFIIYLLNRLILFFTSDKLNQA